MVNESHSQPRRLKKLSDSFEECWKSGTPPRIEEFLQQTEKSLRPSLLSELLAIDIIYRAQRGENPTRHDYLSRFPHDIEIIDAALRTDQKPETVHKTWEKMSTLLIPESSSASDSSDPPLGRFGEYELLDLIGQGGMGIVYKARQISTDRVVALKVIRPERLGTSDDEKKQHTMMRFRVEAKAASRLEHENLVTVYDAGEVEGQPYYTMRYVDGRSLHSTLSGSLLDVRRSAEIMREVARGVHAAHQHGILHRDLKPENILIDATSGRALVSDFGLAKLVEEPGVTLAGVGFGTPQYMPPEQAEDATQVTIRSDVYSLGATLYHLLTGAPPFCGELFEILRQVKDDSPRPPRLINRDCPEDLEALCLRCLEKEPQRRLASAEGFADELTRFLVGEPLHVRPVGTLERAHRWIRRNAIVAGLGFGFVISLIIGLAFSLYFMMDAREQTALLSIESGRVRAEATKATNAANEAQKKTQLAEAAQKELSHSLYLTGMKTGQLSLDNGDVESARQILQPYAHPGEEDLRNVEWYILWNAVNQPHVTLDRNAKNSRLWSMAFVLDDQYLAVNHGRGLQLWNIVTGKLEQEKRGDSGNVTSIAALPGGKSAIVGTGAVNQRGSVVLWRMDPLSVDRVLATDLDPVVSLTISADGQYAVAATTPLEPGFQGSQDRFLRVSDEVEYSEAVYFDLATGNIQARLQHPEAGVVSVDISPDGSRIVTGDSEGNIRIWNAETHDVEHLWRATTGEEYGYVWVTEFSPDGTLLVTSRGAYAQPGEVRIWNLASQEVVSILPESDGCVFDVSFSPDGQRLATASWDKTVRLWQIDKSTGDNDTTKFKVQPLAKLTGHNDGVFDLAYSSDGMILASGTFWDGEIRLWDAVHSDQFVKLSSLGRARTPDFRIDAKISTDRLSVILRNLFTGYETIIPGDGNSIQNVRLSSSGRYLLVFSEIGGTRVWDLTKREIVREWSAVDVNQYRELSGTSNVALSSTDPSSDILYWDVDKSEITSPEDFWLSPDLDINGQTFRGRRYSWMDFSPSRNWCVINSSAIDLKQRYALAVETKTGRSFELTVPASFLWENVFSPDESLVATGNNGKPTRIYDLERGELVAEIEIDGLGLAFSADSRKLFTSGADGALHAWDCMTGEHLASQRGHTDIVYGMDITSDRTRIATASWDGTVRIWDTESLQTVIVLQTPFPNAWYLTFSEDDQFLLVSCYTHAVLYPAKRTHLSSTPAIWPPSDPVIFPIPKLIPKYSPDIVERHAKIAGWLSGQGAEVSISNDGVIEKVWLEDAQFDDQVFRKVSEIETLHELSVSSSSITDSSISYLSGHPKLVKLTLDNAQIQGRCLEALKSCKNLSLVSLADIAIEPENLKYLEYYPELHTLWLRSMVLSDDVFRSLSRNSRLIFLTIDNCDVTDSNMAALVSETSENLQSIRISDSPKLSDAGIANLKSLPSLRTLGLNNVAVTGSFLSELRNLEFLHLYSVPLESRFVPSIVSLPKLRLLNIRNTRIDDDAFKTAMPAATLTDLRLSDNLLSGRYLDRFPNLKSLLLTGNTVKSDGVDAIAKLKVLEDLTLDASAVSDAELLQLKNHAKLNSLTIEFPMRPDSERPELLTKTIASVAELDQIRNLKFSGMAMRPDMIPLMMQMQHLESLNLWNIRDFDETQENRLRNSLPSAKIDVRRVGIRPSRIANSHSGSIANAELKLSSQQITSDEVDRILSQKSTRDLLLIDVGISDSDLKRLISKLPLRSLTLQGDSFSDRSISELSFPETLRSLSIVHCPVSDASIAKILPLPQLEQLDLTRTNIEGSCLSALDQMEDLKELELFGTQLTDEGVGLIPSLQHLESLTLGMTQVTGNGIANLNPQPQLKLLGLRSIDVTDEGSRHLNRFPLLEDLDISYSQISDEGMKKVELPKLKILLAFRTKIRGPGLTHLLNLEELDLMQSSVLRDEDLVQIAGLEKLRVLSIRSTQVTDNGLLRLADADNLEEADVKYSKVTQDGVKRFLEKCPGVRVVGP